MKTAVLTADVYGRVTLSSEAQEIFGLEGDVVIPPSEWSARFRCYDPVTRMPLENDRLPAYRALSEGVVENVALLAENLRGVERVILASAYASYNAAGEVVGVAVHVEDIQEEWDSLLAAGAIPPMKTTAHLCDCRQWQLEVPIGTPVEWVDEALTEHMQECVVLAANRIRTFG